MEDLEAFDLGGHLHNLQVKFNRLSNWLQNKFHDDPTFPQSLIVTVAEVDPLASIGDDNYFCINEFEPDDTNASFSTHTYGEGAWGNDEKSTLDTPEVRTVQQVQRGELKPCFINLERLKLKKERHTFSTASERIIVEERALETQDEVIEQNPSAQFLDADEDEKFLTDDVSFHGTKSEDPTFGIPNENDPQKPRILKSIGFRKRKQARTASLPCPFCEHRYVRHWILPHVEKYHPDKILSQEFLNLKKCFRKGKVIKPKPAQERTDSNISNLPEEVTVSASVSITSESPAVVPKSQSKLNQMSKTKRRYVRAPCTLILCPFCGNQYGGTYIMTHIQKYHEDKATAAELEMVKQSIKVYRKEYENSKKTRTNTGGGSTARDMDKYSCATCLQEFKVFRSYRLHVKSVHPVVFEEKISSGEFVTETRENGEDALPVNCHICGKTIKRSYLESHIRLVHENTLTFLCSICGYKTTQKRILQSHMEIHENEKKYKCNLCPYASKQYQGLRIHFRRMHDTAQFMEQCSLCGELFKGKFNLVKHISAVHNNVRPYACQFCDKAFKARPHLKYHLQTHANPNSRKRGLNKEREVKRRRSSTKSAIIEETEPLTDLQSL